MRAPGAGPHAFNFGGAEDVDGQYKPGRDDSLDVRLRLYARSENRAGFRKRDMNPPKNKIWDS
jgi:hypothetical protein